MRCNRTTLPALLLMLGCGGASLAQSNLIVGTDVQLGLLETFSPLVREGTFPAGVGAFAMSTTACNSGSVDVPWLAAMQEDHPFISFLIVRETAGQLVQISDRSYVKHGFFALSNAQCSACRNPSDGTFLGVGCSDTYAVVNNGDNFWLGPADEIDPWLGDWGHVCSHFDWGEPPAPPLQRCDGFRSSIIIGQAELGHRVIIKDEDLDVGTSIFHFQGQYTIRGEPEEDRTNNLGSREFVPTWAGNRWTITVPATGNDLVHGSVLERWTGALVNSTRNEIGGVAQDGRVYLGVTTEDLGNGFHRYNYALHNRDNLRGVGSLRLPLCPGAQVQNVSFHDLDDDAGNDWTVTQSGAELVFETPDNPLLWNSIYSFSFECDALPAPNVPVGLAQFAAGAGQDLLTVNSSVPLGSVLGSDLGFGLAGSNGQVPDLRACGDLGTGGTGWFTLRFAPPTTLTFLVGGYASNPTPFLGGTLVPVPIIRLLALNTDAEGSIALPVPGGGGPVDIFAQFVVADAGNPLGWAFSNALQITFDP